MPQRINLHKRIHVAPPVLINRCQPQPVVAVLRKVVAFLALVQGVVALLVVQQVQVHHQAQEVNDVTCRKK